MNRLIDAFTNCPNCGSPIVSDKCEYCGTTFYDFASLEIGKPAYIKIRYNGQPFIAKAILENISISMSRDTRATASMDFTLLSERRK